MRLRVLAYGHRALPRRALCLAICLIFCGLWSGCDLIRPASTPAPSATPAPSTQSPNLPEVIMIGRSFDDPFWKQIQLGADNARKDYGVRLLYSAPSPGDPEDVQLSLMMTAIDRNPKAILLAAQDNDAIFPYIEVAHARGIPVIGFECGVRDPLLEAEVQEKGKTKVTREEKEAPRSLIVTNVGTDNYAAAAEVADRMATAIGNEGTVALILRETTSSESKRREQGFTERMTELYPNIRIVHTDYSQGDVDAAKGIVLGVLGKYPDVNAIFTADAQSTEGAILAMKSLGVPGRIPLFGFDQSPVMRQAIQDSYLFGAVSQDPISIGYRSVEVAYRVMQGEKITADVSTKYFWYDSELLKHPEIVRKFYD